MRTSSSEAAIHAVSRAWLLGSLSKDVFERRTSTGSEAFSLFICLDTTKFILLSFLSPIKTIYPTVSTKPQPNAAKSPLPADVRRSKTLLLKLPNFVSRTFRSKDFTKKKRETACSLFRSRNAQVARNNEA